MTDTGHSFDPDTVGPPVLDQLPEAGMGLFIMRSFMDEIAYQAGPPNVLRMVKRRSSADEPSPEDLPPFSSDTSTSANEDAKAGSRSDWR